MDDLAAFRSIEPAIEPRRDVQPLRGMTVLRWDSPWEGVEAERPRLVVECFACGRPDWYEAILFDPADENPRLVIDLEHLSAEAFAEDFHRMPSLTRSALVKKAIFMPGFTARTGGLVIDRRFAEARGRFLDPAGRAAGRAAIAGLPGLGAARGLEGGSWVAVFGYERDYARIVADLAAFARSRSVLVLAANGKSQGCFLDAWAKAGEPFPAIALPFLPQESWDDLLLACDFSIVRGEESLARAALSGRPFLWQAYPQAGGHHMVKVRALLDRLRPGFAAGLFAPLERAWLAFNDRERDEPSTRGEEEILSALAAVEALGPGFRAFSDGVFALGDLAGRLLTFMGEIG